MVIDFGIELGNTEPWTTLREAALCMDGQLWRTAWTYDHLIPCTASELPLTVSSAEECEEGPILEGWTLLAGLAAITSRVRLGTMVSCMTMRHPVLLAKNAVTVDHISGGRVDLGVGTGWLECEHRALHIELGTPKEQSDRLEEGSRILQQCLHRGGRFSVEGKFYSVDNAPFAPLPVQSHLPLLIGGGGEKRTLRTVARYGDACNVYANMFGSYDEVVRKMRVLDRHCEECGRDPREIRRTVTMYADIIDDESEAFRYRRFMGQHLYDEEADALPFGSAQRIVDAIAPYVDLGIGEIVFNGPKPTPEKLTRLNDEVLHCFL